MAETTNHIIRYLPDISRIIKSAKSIENINRNLAKNFGKDFTKAASVVNQQFKKINTRAVFDKKLGRSVVKSFGQLETVIKGVDGQLRTVTQNGEIVGDTFKKTNTTIREGAKVSRSFGDNLKTLLKRAALTIPVWFALRQGIGSVFRIIRDGLKDIADFDTSLQKLGRNVRATSNNFEKDFPRIKKTIEEFSIESGKSVEEITNAVQRFATVGFDIDTALSGGIQATKLAVTLFGDAEDTANAFARSLRVLTADLETGEEQQRAISEALALTDQLWQTNAFEINEFSNNLEKFAGTAKIANLSIEDTLTLLATLSTAGLSNRGGRLLRSTILRSLADFENINRELNLGLDPNQTPTIEFVLSLVQALKDLRSTGNIPAELSETLADLFSVRSTEALAGLTALEKILKENIALNPDVKEFENTFEDLNKEITRLSAQSSNLGKEFGRQFTAGIFGGDDFRNSLERIVEIQERLVAISNKLGKSLNNAFNQTSFPFLFELLSGDVDFNTLEKIFNLDNIGILNLGDGLGKSIQEGLAAAPEAALAVGEELSKKIIDGFKGNLSSSELSDLITDLETFGSTQSGLEGLNLDLVTQQLETQIKITKEKERQTIATKKQSEVERTNKDLAEVILDDSLKRAKFEGATDAQIIKREIALRKQLDIELKGIDSVQKKLELERALNEEKRLGTEISSEALKLFRISQESGVDVARRIGDVLSGDLDLDTFIRIGGQAADIFKKEFEDVFEAQQAKRFFSGLSVPGLSGLRGGESIDVGFNRNVPSFDARAAIREASALRDLRPQVTQTNSITIQNNITTNNPSEVKQAAEDAIVEGLSNPNSKLSKKIKDFNLNL